MGLQSYFKGGSGVAAERHGLSGWNILRIDLKCVQTVSLLRHHVVVVAPDLIARARVYRRLKHNGPRDGASACAILVWSIEGHAYTGWL